MSIKNWFIKKPTNEEVNRATDQDFYTELLAARVRWERIMIQAGVDQVSARCKLEEAQAALTAIDGTLEAVEERMKPEPYKLPEHLRHDATQ